VAAPGHFDHTGDAVGRAEIAISDRAHIVNIEAEKPGIEAACAALSEKLRKEFPEVELQIPSEVKRLDWPDLDAAAIRLSAETGSPYTPAARGEIVAGIYQQPLTLASGRCAVIDNGLGFALVPWTALRDSAGVMSLASPKTAAVSNGVSGASAGWRFAAW
jgi:hypothetical protein